MTLTRSDVREEIKKELQLNRILLGVVKEIVDETRMGKLKVWIPDIGGKPTEPSSWFTVSYCSPFAGATNIEKNTRGGETMSGTQHAYGMWMVPPDINNEVIVTFIDGDASRGIYFGCLYQKHMNHSVPDNTSNDSTNLDTVEGNLPPVTEYNKKGDVDVSGNNPDPQRPGFEPLDEGLRNQGLYGDDQRGVSDSGAKREVPSQVYGIKTPRGHCLYFDDGKLNDVSRGVTVNENNERSVDLEKDDESDEFIRLRTRSGVQILINDTTGFIYMNTKNGNSWMELSDDGVNCYTSENMGLRVENDLSVRVDGDYNLEVNGDMNWRVIGDVNCQFESKLNLINSNVEGGSSNGITVTTDGKLHIKTQEDFNIESPSEIQLGTDGSLKVSSGGSFSVDASSDVILKGSQVQENGIPPQVVTSPDEAEELSLNNIKDAGDDPPSYDKTDIENKTILSDEQLVTHEPWSHHPERD